MSVSFESLAGASPSVSYGSLTASLPECTRFDTLDGAFLLRTSQRYEYLANQGIRTTLSFITVRSQTSNSSAANSAQNISATAPALQSSDHTTPTSPLPPSSAFTADAAVDTESHAPSDRTAVASIASATAAGDSSPSFRPVLPRILSAFTHNVSAHFVSADMAPVWIYASCFKIFWILWPVANAM
ncbi:hypothetical protein BC830DRAFT_1099766 [Chytriomyces sp. MP71]|nr:hypothetical protein BC830DRAFT_1099766 [Chytriomyces sp. MP71]